MIDEAVRVRHEELGTDFKFDRTELRIRVADCRLYVLPESRLLRRNDYRVAYKMTLI